MNIRLGGDIPFREFLERGYQRRLAAALERGQIAARGWPHQCRCGSLVVVRYRGRFYCPLCGLRIRRCVLKMQGHPCGCDLPAV